MADDRTRHILLVEDHLPDARGLQRVMARLAVPHRLHIVSDGSEGLLFLRRTGAYATAPCADLVLLDLNLPRVSGYEVLAQAKADPALRQVPIIVLSGSEHPSDIERCYGLGANAYLIKPGTPEQLTRLVQTLDAFWFGLGRTPSQP